MFFLPSSLDKENSPPGGKRRSLKPAFQVKEWFFSGVSVDFCLRSVAASQRPTLHGKRSVMMMDDRWQSVNGWDSGDLMG